MNRDDEAARYREAARQAIDQLDWCVEYFRSIRKTKISRQLAKNRAFIAQRLAAEDEKRFRNSTPGP
jgi:Tfp pilus assembly ATPase PilU